jgi:hypothetical protein
MFTSLWRALPRILILAFIGTLCVHGSVPIGLLLGAAAAPILFNVGLLFYALAAGDAALRMLMPRIDAQILAASDTTASALQFLGHCLLRAAMFLLFAGAAHAAQPQLRTEKISVLKAPAAALAYLPVLKAQQRTYWPELQQAAVLGAQIHRETQPCPGRQCWSPHAQLRTQREQGIGFGQFTRTWNSAGLPRFDALTDIVRAHPHELAGLSWSTPYDPELQLRALVLKDRDLFAAVNGAATIDDRLAFALAGYNGGAGSVRSDRLMCEAKPGCDPTRWRGNVERTSLKARQAVQGYGQSWFEINRGYVREILLVLRPMYAVLDAA